MDKIHCFYCLNNSVGICGNHRIVLCPKDTPTRAFMYDELELDTKAPILKDQTYRKVAMNCENLVLEEGDVDGQYAKR